MWSQDACYYIFQQLNLYYLIVIGSTLDNCLGLPKRNGLIILVQKNIFHTYLFFLLEKFLFLAKFNEIHIHFFFLSISRKSKVISLPLSLSSSEVLLLLPWLLDDEACPAATVSVSIWSPSSSSLGRRTCILMMVSLLMAEGVGMGLIS